MMNVINSPLNSLKSVNVAPKNISTPQQQGNAVNNDSISYGVNPFKGLETQNSIAFKGIFEFNPQKIFDKAVKASIKSANSPADIPAALMDKARFSEAMTKASIDTIQRITESAAQKGGTMSEKQINTLASQVVKEKDREALVTIPLLKLAREACTNQVSFKDNQVSLSPVADASHINQNADNFAIASIKLGRLMQLESSPLDTILDEYAKGLKLPEVKGIDPSTELKQPHPVLKDIIFDEMLGAMERNVRAVNPEKYADVLVQKAENLINSEPDLERYHLAQETLAKLDNFIENGVNEPSPIDIILDMVDLPEEVKADSKEDIAPILAPFFAEENIVMKLLEPQTLKLPDDSKAAFSSTLEALQESLEEYNKGVKRNYTTTMTGEEVEMVPRSSKNYFKDFIIN